jgi:hypothetical protein
MRSMFTLTRAGAPVGIPGLAAVAVVVALALSGCSSVFTGTVSGTVYDAASYGEDDPETLGNIEVYLYQEEEDRDADFDVLTGAAEGEEPTRYYDTTASGGDGTFTLNFVWNTLFPDYGDTGDREEVYLMFYDPGGEYSASKKSAVVISEFTTNVVGLLNAARARATVTGTVEDALSGAGLGDVTVSGYLPSSWEYSGGGVNVTEWGGPRAFRVSTGDGGGYEASFTFPKSLDPGAAGDERIQLRLLFSRTSYQVSTDGDSDLSSGADVDGDSANDVYYQTPVIFEQTTTAMDTIGIKPTEFTVTVNGKVWFDDGDNTLETTGSPPPDTPTNGETVVLSVTYRPPGASSDVTDTYRTTSERTGVGTDAEDGTFSIDGVSWKDTEYSGTQSTASATITIEGANNVHVPSGSIDLISGTQNYVEVLFD